jgi:iron complex transport system substrate-binding protein
LRGGSTLVPVRHTIAARRLAPRPIGGRTIVAAATIATMLAACTARDAAPALRDTTSATKSAPARAAADTDDFGTPFLADTTLGTRVVSLVPAATEVIFAMGRGARLVGRTTWDTSPDSAKLVANVGDGIRPNVEAVLATRPTLVVLYAGNDNRAAAAAFARAGVSVFAIKVDHIADFVRLTTQLGTLLDAADRARQVVDTVQSTLAHVRTAVEGAPRPTVVWPLWDSPILVVGHGSFASELLDVAGADNVFADLTQPSPEVTIEEIAKRNPALVLSSPLGTKRLLLSPKWKTVRAVREGGIRVVDTTLVGRPTVTLGMAAASLARLLHPDRAARLP